MENTSTKKGILLTALGTLSLVAAGLCFKNYKRS